MDNKITELLRKLKALAERGDSGEAINAQKMLDNLLIKYRISLSEIEEEIIETFHFSIKNTTEERLLLQIGGCVKASIKFYNVIKKARKAKGIIAVKCSPSEYILIDQMFNHYKNLLDKEFEVFFLAFLKVNDLLVSDTSSRKLSDLTPEEIEELNRINDMAKGMKAETYKKQIQSST